MKKLINTPFLAAAVFVAFLSVSCKKKCDLGQDITSGEIKSDISIYPASGYLTAQMTSDQYLITGDHAYADRYQISANQGMDRKDINYNEYSILCYPMTVSCFAQFDRNVVIDDVNGVVKYTIKVKDCGKCEEDRYVENYVAIRAIPSSYLIIYDTDIQTFN